MAPPTFSASGLGYVAKAPSRGRVGRCPGWSPGQNACGQPPTTSGG